MKNNIARTAKQEDRSFQKCESISRKTDKVECRLCKAALSFHESATAVRTHLKHRHRGAVMSTLGGSALEN